MEKEDDDWAESDWDSDEQNENDFDFKVENGLIPYVYEQKGNDPIAESGIPADVVFTPQIADLFLKTFGETGRLHPESRPSASEWAEAFEEAVNLISICSNGHTNLDFNCIWCQREKHSKGDQNRYFRFETEDVILPESNEEWDKSPIPDKPAFYKKNTINISHRIDSPTSVNIPPKFLSNTNKIIDARVEIKSTKLTFSMHGKGLSPSEFIWEYKSDKASKSFYIKENGIPTKIVTISLVEVTEENKE